MDMSARPQERFLDQRYFHLTGKLDQTAGSGWLNSIDGLDLRPALLAPYRDLAPLRHDFPVVLVDGGDGAAFVRSLSGLVDEMLHEVAPRGIEGERLRRHALQLETEIRRAVDAGAQGTLSELWNEAAARLGAREGETLEQVLTYAGGTLRADGPVLGCTPQLPARLITHAWRATQRAKAQRFHADLARLVLKLSDILRAAFNHSEAGRRPTSLAASVGGPHRDAFDFEAMSRIVGRGAPRDELPPSRHARLLRTLRMLESQRFFAPCGPTAPDDNCFDFVFDNCAAAATAFRSRLDEVAELVKALAVAELEAQGRYDESEHDHFFAVFDAHSLTADDLARLPDYLVCIPPGQNDAPENAQLMEVLSSGLPVKVLVQTSELLEDASIGTGHFAFGVRSARLATTAMGLGGMFVLQSASANLYALREKLERGLTWQGPSLFSVFAADGGHGGRLAPYLSAAAAMQSRAFPAFCYDAAAGENWATRFSLENNPAHEDDWAVDELVYADDRLQRSTEPCAFTFADFVLCDPRYASHFALVPRERWHDDMVPVAQWLKLPDAVAAQRVPYLLVADAQDTLQRVVVDITVMQATRRCLLLWRRLQEHGGVHDSHAERLLAQERAARAAEPPAPAAAAVAPTPAVAEAAAPAEQAAPAHSRDEAWIETERCPSCNECQLINDRLFAYNEKKQAYIKDIAAGTYRQLVEAAEVCQVAIIHPGKPRDPNEPGLEELLARAEPFR